MPSNGHTPAKCSVCHYDGNLWEGANPALVKCPECGAQGTMVEREPDNSPATLENLRRSMVTQVGDLYGLKPEHAESLIALLGIAPPRARQLAVGSHADWHAFLATTLVQRVASAAAPSRDDAEGEGAPHGKRRR